MQSVTKYRFVFVLSLVIAVITVECLGWQKYAHYAAIGFCVYFLIVFTIILFTMLLKVLGRRRRIKRLRENLKENPINYNEKQALGRIKRDIDRLSKWQ